MAMDAERNELAQLAARLNRLLWDARSMRTVREAVCRVGRGLLARQEAHWAWQQKRDGYIKAALADPAMRNEDEPPPGVDGLELDDQHDMGPVPADDGWKMEGPGWVRVWLPTEYHTRNEPPTPELFPRCSGRDWDAEPLTEDEKLTLAGIVHDAQYTGSGVQLIKPWTADRTLDPEQCPMYPIGWPRREWLLDWWENAIQTLREGELVWGEWSSLRVAGEWSVAMLSGRTRVPSVPTVSLPRQPEPVQAAIDALGVVITRAECVCVGIEEGRRWRWDQIAPKPQPPLPSIDEFVAEQRVRIEAAGIQTWDDTLDQKARSAWEDLQEGNNDWERQRESYAEWRQVLLQDWADLMGAIPVTQAAIKALRPHLAEAVAHPGEWISGVLRTLGYMSALRRQWGERPWVGDAGELTPSIADLLDRTSLLQMSDFGEPTNGETKAEQTTNAGPPMNASMKRRGDFWELMWGDESAVLKHGPGTVFLAYLLDNPNPSKEVDPLALVKLYDGAPTPAAEQHTRRAVQQDFCGEGVTLASEASEDEAFDKRSMQAAVEETQRLEKLLSDTPSANPGMRTEWKDQIRKCEDYLRQGFAFHGRKRTLDALPMKRASDRVRQALGRVRGQLDGQSMPNLSEHLEAHFRPSGYKPPADSPPWTVDGGS